MYLLESFSIKENQRKQSRRYYHLKAANMPGTIIKTENRQSFIAFEFPTLPQQSFNCIFRMGLQYCQMLTNFWPIRTVFLHSPHDQRYKTVSLASSSKQIFHFTLLTDSKLFEL